MPTVEFFSVSASEAYLKDPTILKPVLDILINAPGSQRVYYGLQELGVNTLWVVIVWDNYEAHKALIDDPSYQKLLEGLKPVFGGTPSMYHVQFHKDPIKAFEAPSTEILSGTLKEDGSKEILEEAFSELGVLVDGKPGNHSYPTFGPTREDPKKYFFTIGWDSQDARISVLRGPEYGELFKAPIGKLRGVFDLTLIHASLKRYTA